MLPALDFFVLESSFPLDMMNNFKKNNLSFKLFSRYGKVPLFSILFVAVIKPSQ